jgi:hypothetical protein
VFAPNFKNRNKIVPVKKIINEKNTESKSKNTSNSKVKIERLRWAEMLKKTFEIDVTICPKCNGRLEQVAVIKFRKVAMAILKSLNQNTDPLPVGAPPTGPPELLSYENEIDQRHDDW